MSFCVLLLGDNMSDSQKNTHTLMLENRALLELTGVSNVESFNEEEVTATTDYGDLLIKGDNLNVEVLDLQSGNLKVSGTVSALVYTNRVDAKGFFKRVFSS